MGINDLSRMNQMLKVIERSVALASLIHFFKEGEMTREQMLSSHRKKTTFTKPNLFC